MKPPQFDYRRPSSLDEALALLAQTELDPMPLAGGQSLVPMMNFRMSRPGMLVDLNRIDGLSGVTETGGLLRIGAMTRYVELTESEAVQRAVPLLALALPHVAHPAIRNRGTVGGSLALADPAAELPAVALALGATLHLERAGAARDVEADDYFLGLYETAREDDELLTAVSIPIAAPADRCGFYEIARRHGDYAMAGVAVAANGGAWRIAFFGVADRPLRAEGAEAVLNGDAANVAGAVAALSDLDFGGDLNGAPDTKRHLAGVALTRAIKGMAQ